MEAKGYISISTQMGPNYRPIPQQKSRRITMAIEVLRVVFPPENSETRAEEESNDKPSLRQYWNNLYRPYLDYVDSIINVSYNYTTGKSAFVLSTGKPIITKKNEENSTATTLVWERDHIDRKHYKVHSITTQPHLHQEECSTQRVHCVGPGTKFSFIPVLRTANRKPKLTRI